MLNLLKLKYKEFLCVFLRNLDKLLKSSKNRYIDFVLTIVLFLFFFCWGLNYLTCGVFLKFITLFLFYFYLF